MTSLRGTQVWSVLTKVGTVALGIVQSAVVLRLLGPESFGVVSIVISLGSLVGVSQHVGVVDAAIREIAMAETVGQRAKIFWVSLGFRLLVTVPLSLLLALSAPWVEKFYAVPDLAPLIRLMSLILVLFGIQGVLGGAYTGQRAFGMLYVLQLVMALVNVPVFAGLVWWHGVRGFFEAALLAALLFSTLLAFLLPRALGGPVRLPLRREVFGILRNILHTGIWTYVARLLLVAWQRVPVLLLGVLASAETVGLFSAAVTFGSKLQLLAAALGEVNLAFLSQAFARSLKEFRRLAVRTLEDVGAVVLLGGVFLVLFADTLVPLVAGPRYGGAVAFVAPVAWAYAAFAYLDIAANTVFVPARRAHLRAASFFVLLAVTVSVFLVFREAPAVSAPFGVLAGALTGLAVAAMLSSHHMRISFVPRSLILPLAAAGGSTLLSSASLTVRLGIFAAVALWVFVVAFPSLSARVRERLGVKSA